MNIHFPQAQRKPQLFSYLLAVFAVCTMLMLSLSFIRMAELRLSIPAISIHSVQTENDNMPVAVPAPMPPVERTQAIATTDPAENTRSIFVPQVVPAPAPSVP